MASTSRNRVAVLTDSAADIPAALLDEYQIHVIPLYLTMGGKTWQDRVDISPNKFYELLSTSRDFPKTSQPNVENFKEKFVEISKSAQSIAAVLVSGGLSGTVASARAAKELLPDIPIEIIDTRGVSMMEGFTVLAAARAASQGYDLQTVVEAARSMIGRSHVYFVVDTFEYLHRGGRIGTAAKMLGTTLNIKPVLEIRDGVAEPVAQVRTKRKALARVLDLLKKQASNAEKSHMAVVNVAAEQEAAQFQQQLVQTFHPEEILATDCSPVLGAHVGPGTVGVAYYFE